MVGTFQLKIKCSYSLHDKAFILTFLLCLNENERLPPCANADMLEDEPSASPTQYTRANSGLELGPPRRVRLKQTAKC